MKFSSDYESLLLLVSLLLSLFAYLFRRHVFIKKEASEPESGSGEKEEVFPFQDVLKKKENIFLVSALAWLLFLVYILITIARVVERKGSSGYYGEGSLYMDVIFLLFALFCAYHEYVCWKNRKDYRGLRFLNGGFAIYMLVYLVFYSFPQMAAAVVYASAYKTSAILTLFGYDTQAGSVDLGGNHGLFRENENYISSEILRAGQTDLIDINLTCAALPGVVIFLALALLSERDWQTKAKALVVAPIIYLLNVLRMAGIIYVVYTGRMDYFLAHDVISRILSLIALLVLFAYFFRLLPDVHKDFLSALHMHKKHRIRKTPNDTNGANLTNG